MRKKTTLLLLSLLVTLTITVFAILPVQAGERLLTVNGGTVNEVFFISGERTLVMNGFDLTPLKIVRPAVIDKVTIVVDTPVPGAPIEVVVYEDGNGGSPVDATLAGRETVNIGNPGSVTITLAHPITVVQPVIWVGFYLPPDFKFYADTTGTSVLTYWAWTPGGEFDLNNLSSAGVLGPGDGSSPVNIDMGGKARITAEITSANPALGTPVIEAPRQLVGNFEANLAELMTYPDCADIRWDTADVAISYEYSIGLHCQKYPSWHAPPAPNGYALQGFDLYNITMFTADGRVKPAELPIFVTHCIAPNIDDADKAVIGIAYGAPMVWHILATVRVDNLICAELPHQGYIAYFLPTS